MSLPLRAALVLVAGALVLVLGAALHLGTLAQVFGGLAMLIGAGQLARVQFNARARGPGESDISLTVKPGGDVGFDEKAESLENRGESQPDTAPD